MNETKQIVKYTTNEAEIAKMSALYMSLTVTDIADKEQVSQVHDARIVMKNHRIAVDKERKALKADALAWGKKVQAEANHLLGLIEPIESHLKAEEQKVIDEKNRIKAEAEKAEHDRRNAIQEKINTIQRVFIGITGMDSKTLASVKAELESMQIDPEEYKEFTDQAQTCLEDTHSAVLDAIEARKKFEAEEIRRKEEAAKLNEIRRQQEEAQKKIEAEKEELRIAQKKIDDDNRKIQEEKDRIAAEKQSEADRIEREAFEKKAQEEAKIKAEKEAREKAEREEQKRVDLEKEKQAEAERKEALRPDQEKIIMFAEKLRAIEPPILKTNESINLGNDVMSEISELLDSIIERANKL